MKRNGSIRYRLFLTYAAISILISTIYAGAFYLYESQAFTSRSLAGVNELSISLSNKLDLEIQKMDNVTLSVAYSNLIKDRLVRIARDNDQEDRSYTIDQVSDIKELSEIMVAAIGPSQSVRNLTIYDLEGNRISSGALTKYGKKDVTQMPWYETVINKEGGSVIGLPEKDEELAHSFVYFRDKYFISLYRTYFGDFGKIQGIIQAQQDAEVVFSSLIELEKEAESDKWYYVINDEGEQLYPYKNKDTSGDYYYNQYMNADSLSFYVDNPTHQGKELVSYYVSKETGWILAVVTSRDALIESLKQYMMKVIITTFVLLVLLLVFSYYAAQTITKPIARLHSAIKKMDINGYMHPDQYIKSDINEIEALQLAFNSMNAKLQHSVETLLFSQSQEIRATMAALSSQMNPHFLFNTITTISIMAEEGMSGEITRLCQKLSSMLRYISSEASNEVSLGAEIAYTSTYLECMKIRYPEDLLYLIEIEDELLNIPIPKLLIQPLVENCMKHGIHVQSPWRIRISGKVFEDQWTITVSDNGPGMSGDKRKELFEKINELDKSNKFPGLNVEGMGLINIYFRLKLTYNELMIFHIDESSSGFVITIGGRVSNGQ
jgi:two-component system sensor histidine kinase YesM